MHVVIVSLIVTNNNYDSLKSNNICDSWLSITYINCDSKLSQLITLVVPCSCMSI